MESIVEYQMKRTNRNLLLTNAISISPLLLISYVVLNAIPFNSGGWVFVVFESPLLILCILNFRKYILRRETPSQHPIHKSLNLYGDPDSLITQIDNEFRSNEKLVFFSKSAITNSWLLIPNMFTAHFIPLSYIIWIYKHRTTNLINFIPLITYKSIIITRNGLQFDMPNSQAKVNKALEAIYERVPWIQVGYSKDLMHLRNTNLREFVSAIDTRKIQMFEGSTRTGG